MLSSPLNLTTHIFFFLLWQRNVLNSFCSELYLGKTFLYMAVLSSVTFLMVHFHLCYSGGAESSMKHSPCQVTYWWGSACPSPSVWISQLLHPGKSGIKGANIWPLQTNENLVLHRASCLFIDFTVCACCQLPSACGPRDLLVPVHLCLLLKLICSSACLLGKYWFYPVTPHCCDLPL